MAAVDTYLVRLCDRKTGEGQQVLVQDKNPDRDWQEWIDSAAASFDPPLTISNPKVMHAHRLRMKRPVKTVLPQATAV
jgi:hypothetical protein